MNKYQKAKETYFEELKNQQEYKHKECLELSNKIKYLLDNPIGKSGYIYHINTFLPNFLQFYKSYSPKCKELHKIVDDNKNNENVSIYIEDHIFINHYTIHVNNNKIIYNLNYR